MQPEGLGDVVGEEDMGLRMARGRRVRLEMSWGLAGAPAVECEEDSVDHWWVLIEKNGIKCCWGLD